MVMAQLDDAILETKHEEYMAWLLTPRDDRQPSSKEKYALEHGFAQQTLRNWEKREAFRAEWSRRVDQAQGSPERKSNLLDSLYAKGMAGDVRSAELFFKVTGGIMPTVTKVEVAKASTELSDDELNELIAKKAGSEIEARMASIS